jgi:hypothetical protein
MRGSPRREAIVESADSSAVVSTFDISARRCDGIESSASCAYSSNCESTSGRPGSMTRE